MTTIVSRQNPRYREVARLVGSSRERRKRNRCVLEGEHLIDVYLERVGMPEGGIILAHAVTYCASAPKSNAAYLALKQAQAAIEAGANLEVPLHLRNASFGGARWISTRGGTEPGPAFLPVRSKPPRAGCPQ